MKGKSKYVRESFRLYLPPAVGYNFPLLLKLLSRHGVHKGYAGRALIISLVSMIGVPFRIYEKWVYDRPSARVSLEEPPIFILGHWRSGTTHLHNLLCQDPASAYVTTYQSVFPDQALAPLSRFIFKNIMNMLIPINRKGDNVKLGIDYPQEEEFAIAARSPACYYFFWYFPDLMRSFYDQFLTFEKAEPRLREAFLNDYRRIVNKAVINTGKPRFLAKNPVHTGRIPLLLEMYPDARFIHIHRNPVDVILSTRHFFSKMMPGLTLHRIDFDKVNADIYYIYRKMMRQYLDTRSLIPAGNLVELGYDDLTGDTMGEIKRIYRSFGLEGYDRAAPLIKTYADSKKDYVRNKYAIEQQLLDEIHAETAFMHEEYGYDPPRSNA